MLRSAQLLLAMLFLTLLGACGQKGALYLPDAELDPDNSTEQSQSEPSLDN